MSYWNKVLEEVLHQSDPYYPTIFTNVREYAKNSITPAGGKSERGGESVEHLAKKRTQIAGPPKKYPLGDKFPGVYFTKREAQVVFYFIQGMNMAQVARLLELSRRTVEFYVNNIKTKLDCRLKSELISKAIQSDFLKLTDFGKEIKEIIGS